MSNTSINAYAAMPIASPIDNAIRHRWVRRYPHAGLRVGRFRAVRWTGRRLLIRRRNAGTTAADSSGNGNNGTLVNGATWSTTAKFGAAASFDGSNDRIDVADNSNSLDLTSG